MQWASDVLGACCLSHCWWAAEEPANTSQCQGPEPPSEVDFAAAEWAYPLPQNTVALKPLKENFLVRRLFPICGYARTFFMGPSSVCLRTVEKTAPWMACVFRHVRGTPSTLHHVYTRYTGWFLSLCLCTCTHACVLHARESMNKVVVARNRMISQVSKIGILGIPCHTELRKGLVRSSPGLCPFPRLTGRFTRNH